MKKIYIFRDYPITVVFKKLMVLLCARASFLMPDKYYLVRYRGGRIYLNLKESPIMIAKAFGVYEYWKTKLLVDLVREEMTLIDIGANKGYFTLLFARLMNENGRVYSFEPIEENCSWIQKSISANGYRCIELAPLALSDNEGTRDFYPGAKSGWGSFFYSPEESMAANKKILVNTRTLDSFLKERQLEDVDLIKIDVQGAELLVLKGAADVLSSSKKIKLLVDVDIQSEEDRELLVNMLKSYDFKLFRIGKKLYPISHLDPSVKDIYASKD